MIEIKNGWPHTILIIVVSSLIIFALVVGLVAFIDPALPRGSRLAVVLIWAVINMFSVPITMMIREDGGYHKKEI